MLNKGLCNSEILIEGVSDDASAGLILSRFFNKKKKKKKKKRGVLLC